MMMVMAWRRRITISNARQTLMDEEELDLVMSNDRGSNSHVMTMLMKMTNPMMRT